METRALRYFVAVAEELHFARAAARVGIEQSPLSKAISELERHLGVQLFLRTRRSTVLTFAGESLLKDAKRILTAVDQAHHNIVRAAAGCRGRLRIAICDGLAQWRISKLIAESRLATPEVDIELIHGSLTSQLRGLCCGSIDIGFAMSRSDDPQVVCVPLWSDAVAVVMQPDHPLSAQPTVRHFCIESGAIMLLGEESRSHALPGWFRKAKQQCVAIEHVEHVELLLTLVAAGYGIGLVSATLAVSTPGTTSANA